MYSSLWKKRDEREWNVTNNKRNLLPLLHGRTPQGGNVNDIPRDEVDLERKRERESSSKCWKIRLESKKEGLVSFFFGNTISKNCTNTGNTCKTYYYWNAASLIWRTTLFVSKANDTIKWISGRWTFAWRKRTFVNENPGNDETWPGDYTVFIRWSKISRRAGANSGWYIYIDLIKLRDLQTVNYTPPVKPESGIIQGILVAKRDVYNAACFNITELNSCITIGRRDNYLVNNRKTALWKSGRREPIRVRLKINWAYNNDNSPFLETLYKINLLYRISLEECIKRNDEKKI